ncbi:MAG: magnesium transporter [Reichenbachiella sp.]|uniref:magnesium transporter n=1 Tax=Reichenbachiella sp. TaxID=2184521 RepID=UPI003263D4EE
MHVQIRPWEILKKLIALEDAAEIKLYLHELTSENIAGAISHIDNDEKAKLVTLLQPEDAAEMMEDIPWVQAVKMLEDLNAKEAAAIIAEMRSDDQADYLAEMDQTDAEAIMIEMEVDEVENIRKLIQYDSDTAGGLMITEFLSFDEDNTVDFVVNELRHYSDKYEQYSLQYLYVTSDGKFVGVLQMKDLLLSKATTRLSEVVLRDALIVKDSESVTELISFFDKHDFYGVPVLNNTEELVGVVLRKDIRETEAEIANIEHLETQGIVGGEELRTMPILLRARRRLSWLSVNILLNMMAASIIAIYQETLTAVIALAVFLPIISDMSGCSGNQAVAVSLRELSLGVIRPFEMLRVWIQEVSVGIINGIVLGTLIGAGAWLWQGNIYLGLVVGGALAINTVIAVSLGGTIPLFLKKMNVDPALASGPILTTVTDMFGFFLALTFAGMMLKQTG